MTDKIKVTGTKLLVAGLGGFLVGQALAPKAPAKPGPVPAPRKPVDLERYLGKWYEFARYENRFERGCEAATAEYSVLRNGKIKIRNACRKGGLEGGEAVAEGKGKIVPDSGNAKLKISFFGPFYLGDYWVLDHADDYSWSLVGEPSRRFFWILTRAAHPPEALGHELIGRAVALGYDPARLRPTKHF